MPKQRFDEDADDYEDFSKILDDLSYREFQVLCILHGFENDPTYYRQVDKDWNKLQIASLFWDDFLDALQNELNIAKDQVPGVLERLSRTGLYQTFVGSFIDYAGDRGHLTPQCYSLLDATRLGELEGRNERLHLLL